MSKGIITLLEMCYESEQIREPRPWNVQQLIGVDSNGINKEEYFKEKGLFVL